MTPSDAMTSTLCATLVSTAATALKERKEEVNRLNVFPVPDGDTGTNMSLTMDAVVAEVVGLPDDSDIATVCHAVTHSSLMGARGNSGVILSQILRGLCEGVDTAEQFTTELLATSLERSVVVAYQAVRKPVEGTILTVLHDTALAARAAFTEGAPRAEALRRTSAAAFDSVRRTPELLPILKENGVVDAGGYGLAILIEGFVAAALGREITVADVSSAEAPILTVEPINDWDDKEYLYCTEFLLFGDDIDLEEVSAFVSSAGGSELIVGSTGEYKIHVHTNDPGTVLARMTSIGEVADVHINNMRRQTAQRDAGLAAEHLTALSTPTELAPVGFVAVAAGAGLVEILTSLGVNRVVSGGQTMNPSTRDLLDAIEATTAEKIILLPNNKNIIMTANAAASVATKPVVVVPTTAILQAFSAMLAYDESTDDLEMIATMMSEAVGNVRCGEITTAVKNAKAKIGRIKRGQVIGISEDEIQVAGDSVIDVASSLATQLLADGAQTLTLVAGEQMESEQLAALADKIAAGHPSVDVETHRGEQPLYPVLMAAE